MKIEPFVKPRQSSGVFMYYEDPQIYDGWIAIIENDGAVRLRCHWAVNRLDENTKLSIIKRCNKIYENERP